MSEVAATERRRGVPYARIFTSSAEPILPADLADELTGRGFVPGFTDPEGKTTPISEAGLADARFTVGGEGYRVISLSSSKGGGCWIRVDQVEPDEFPDDYVARRTVHRPRLVYRLEAGGGSNSDRHLTEHIAEALMVLTSGAVEIGGLGVRGNKPVIHVNRWVGSLRY